MSLSERLSLALKRSGITQADLARACGVKPPSVHGWLSGKAKFLRGENLLRAAAALGVNQEWLATGDGQMFITESPDSYATLIRNLQLMGLHIYSNSEITAEVAAKLPDWLQRANVGGFSYSPTAIFETLDGRFVPLVIDEGFGPDFDGRRKWLKRVQVDSPGDIVVLTSKDAALQLPSLIKPRSTDTATLPAHLQGRTNPAMGEPIDLENNPDYPAIRRVRFKLSAGASGFGVEYHDEEGAPIVFRRDWYERHGYRPEKLFAVSVANGSMETGLYDGDVVVVNTESTEPKDGVVYAVNYEGEMVIKRLVRDAGQWWLHSDNSDQRRYPRKVCDEHSVILGEIVHKQSERI